ncbi:unnamed protein product [Clonostachys rhizophaga]|uniref:Uncharacterized protein n=1 Tax=Clonostachys rhizophaga TaxID=160324 RepID=A0A9N9VM51_9HYPO|nr:unnamed protein product [Clonostachys rhizophaga]
MNSTTAIVGSSSPARPSSSEFEVGMEDIDEDEYDARRSKPEEVTVQLAMSFLHSSLYLCLLQGFNELTEVRVRVERKRAEMYGNGIDHVTAEDDGGICRMKRQALGWSLEHPYLALLEAKRAFKHVHIDNATGEIHPIVSNDTLAQCLGEAVITWKATRQLVGQDVFLIAAANTFLRFIHFRFGSHYADYIDAVDSSTQEGLLKDIGKDTYVHMESSKWFNLQSSGGRRIALCHVLALLRWHDAQHQLSEMVDDSIASDSDFSME